MIQITRTPDSRLKGFNFDKIVFGKEFTDHMLRADWKEGEWTAAEIVPYGPIQMSPGAPVFHYGQAFFEGMKAYRHPEKDEVYLFQPEKNFERFNRSAVRMNMPEIPYEHFMEGIKTLVGLERNWVKAGLDRALYIRPFMFGNGIQVAARSAEAFSFMVLTCPVMAYYTTPVRVKIETEFSRAAPGGTGYAKCAGNYGGSFYPARLAQEQGYHQVLWTDACTHERIEESGTMNVMFRFDDVLITPPISPTILKGVTRGAIIQLAQDMGYRVEEREITVREVLEAARNGSLKEAFGIGTAAVISPIEAIGHRDDDYILPVIDQPVSARLKEKLLRIQHGLDEDPYGWRVTL